MVSLEDGWDVTTQVWLMATISETSFLLNEGYRDSELCVCISSGGVFGTAVVRPVLQNVWRVPVAGGEGVAVVWSQIQPPWSTDSGQPEQRLHPRLPAVPRLCSPGEAAPPVDKWTWNIGVPSKSIFKLQSCRPIHIKKKCISHLNDQSHILTQRLTQVFAKCQTRNKVKCK